MPELAVEEVVQGLRRLARVGRVTPDAVLAAPELASLPSALGRDERQPEAAIAVADALLRAINSSSARSVARILFGVDDVEARLSLGQRRERASAIAAVTPGSFRVRREPRLLEELARALVVELAARPAAEPRRSGGAHLEIERGPVRTTIPLTAARSPIIIGRDAGCDIELRDDPSVSRHHARLTLINGVWLLEDLGSTNGTETEAGVVTGPVHLGDGDVVTIGRTRLTLRVDRDDPAVTMRR